VLPSNTGCALRSLLPTIWLDPVQHKVVEVDGRQPFRCPVTRLWKRMNHRLHKRAQETALRIGIPTDLEGKPCRCRREARSTVCCSDSIRHYQRLRCARAGEPDDIKLDSGSRTHAPRTFYTTSCKLLSLHGVRTQPVELRLKRVLVRLKRVLVPHPCAGARSGYQPDIWVNIYLLYQLLIGDFELI
jgi:hypothetical protein